MLCVGLCLFVAGAARAASYDAVLHWSKRVELGVPVSGVIHSVYADVGMKVKKGDKLLQLDDTVFKARVMQAKSELKNQEEQYKEAAREEERSQNLYDRTVLSDHELQVAKNNKVKAAALRDHARARLIRARQELRYSSLRAPFNALILKRHAQVGKVIAAKLQPETLFVVADADQMLARLSVSEQQLGRIKIGQKAVVILGDRRFPGEVKAIGFEPEKGKSDTSLYPVDVEFELKGQVLRAGMHVKVELQ
jgi:RND family efflux transporter MFP subunit